MPVIRDEGEDERDILLRRLKGDVEARERLIGGLLDQIRAGRAGSTACVPLIAYLRPWRRVFVKLSEKTLHVSVWNERLVAPYRGGEHEQIPSEPKPWDVEPLRLVVIEGGKR